MIGPANRVAGTHSPRIETALAFTAPGQATWADPSIPHTCGDCAHWVTLKGAGQKHGSLPRILGAHAGPARAALREKAAGVRRVRACREGAGAMSEHDGEAQRGWAEDRNREPQMMMKGYRTMTNALSPEILAKLRAAEGEGLSHDPKNNPPKVVQLLQDKAVGSSWCPSGAKAGQYLIGDTLCDDFVWTPIKFKDTFMEWTVKPRGYVRHPRCPAGRRELGCESALLVPLQRQFGRGSSRDPWAYQWRSVHAEFQSERACRSAQSQLGCQ